MKAWAEKVINQHNKNGLFFIGLFNLYRYAKKGLSQKLKIKLRLSLLLCNFARFGKTKEKSLEMRQKRV